MKIKVTMFDGKTFFTNISCDKWKIFENSIDSCGKSLVTNSFLLNTTKIAYVERIEESYKWIKLGEDEYCRYECPNCGHRRLNINECNYCPKCGLKLIEEADECDCGNNGECNGNCKCKEIKNEKMYEFTILDVLNVEGRGTILIVDDKERVISPGDWIVFENNEAYEFYKERIHKVESNGSERIGLILFENAGKKYKIGDKFRIFK